MLILKRIDTFAPAQVGSGKKYDRNDVASAVKAAIRCSVRDSIPYYVFALAGGYTIKTAGPDFGNQRHYEIDGYTVKFYDFPPSAREILYSSPIPWLAVVNRSHDVDYWWDLDSEYPPFDTEVIA